MRVCLSCVFCNAGVQNRDVFVDLRVCDFVCHGFVLS